MFLRLVDKVVRLSLLPVLMIVFSIIILYLSWLPHPNLSGYGLLPDWLARWTDADDNMNVRTAVPFVFLGLCGGAWLIRTGQVWHRWFITWLALVLVVIVAEAGQLMLPLRHFDWGDISWGAAGAWGGMALQWAGSAIRRVARR